MAFAVHRVQFQQNRLKRLKRGRGTNTQEIKDRLYIINKALELATLGTIIEIYIYIDLFFFLHTVEYQQYIFTGNSWFEPFVSALNRRGKLKKKKYRDTVLKKCMRERVKKNKKKRQIRWIHSHWSHSSSLHGLETEIPPRSPPCYRLFL